MEAIRVWTQENKITAGGILIAIILAMAAGAGNHILAFGEVKQEVESMSKVVDRHEEIIDSQKAIIQSVDAKMNLMLDAWGIKRPEKVEGETD